MSQALESARQESSGIRVYLLAAYYLLTESLSLSVAFLGGLLILFGVTVAPSSKDVFGIPLPTSVLINDVLGTVGLGNPWPSHHLLSPMLVAWGGTLVLIGLLVYGVMWANRVYSRAVRP